FPPFPPFLLVLSPLPVLTPSMHRATAIRTPRFDTKPSTPPPPPSLPSSSVQRHAGEEVGPHPEGWEEALARMEEEKLKRDQHMAAVQPGHAAHSSLPSSLPSSRPPSSSPGVCEESLVPREYIEWVDAWLHMLLDGRAPGREGGREGRREGRKRKGPLSRKAGKGSQKVSEHRNGSRKREVVGGLACLLLSSFPPSRPPSLLPTFHPSLSPSRKPSVSLSP
ncbi:hypothetical protein Naga_100866g1, partial [Nannochloropsis gaditana]